MKENKKKGENMAGIMQQLGAKTEPDAKSKSANSNAVKAAQPASSLRREPTGRVGTVREKVFGLVAPLVKDDKLIVADARTASLNLEKLRNPQTSKREAEKAQKDLEKREYRLKIAKGDKKKDRQAEKLEDIEAYREEEAAANRYGSPSPESPATEPLEDVDGIPTSSAAP